MPNTETPTTIQGPQVNQEEYTRREFIAIFGAISGLLLFRRLNKGRLLPPEMKIEEKTNDEVTNSNDGRTFVNFGDFFVDPSKENISEEDKNRIYRYVHRAGNRLGDIKKAVKKGANYIDMDLYDIFGKIYTEHGIITPIFGGRTNLVVDLTEGEISTTLPPTFEESIGLIASLATSANPLSVHIELKHGQFPKETLERVINILNKYQVPAGIEARDTQHQQDVRWLLDKKGIPYFPPLRNTTSAK
jgi:hypothetical protein